LVESAVYPDRFTPAALEWRLPTPADRERVNTIIFNELVFGRVTDDAKACLLRIIEEFRVTERSDIALLGCTEIPLAVTPDTSPLPTLDSTRLLATQEILAGAP
jgi:aspartate racemase